MDAPRLRRGPFGYTSRSVRVVLADRDRLLVKASERARAAEAQMLDRRAEAETLKTQLAEQAERFRAPGRAAEEGSGEIALIRQELSSVRWHLLIESQLVKSAEGRIEVLEAEVRSQRPELEAGLSAAMADLEAARVAVEEAAARPAADPSVTSEGTSAVLEAAGWTMARMNGSGTHAAGELAEAERARRETLAEIERLAACRARLASIVGVVRSTIEDARERAAGIGDRVDEAVAPLTEAITELSDRLAAFAELAALPGEDTREPASERSFDPIELEEQDGAPGQPDPAGGVGAGTSHEPGTEEARGPAAEGIVSVAGPRPID